MSEEAGTTNLGDGNQDTGSPGGSGEGQGGSGLDQFQSQLAALEERRRHFQGLADQREAKIKLLEGELGSFEELKAELDGLKGQLATVGKGPSVEEIAAKVAEQVAAQQALANWKFQVGQKYSGVDLASITGNSLEEIESAAKAKYDEQQAVSKALEAEAEKRIRAKYEAAFGKLSDDANADVMDQGDRGAADGGAMTLEKFMSLSDDEAAKLPDDVWQKYMAEAQAKEAAG